MDKPQDILKEIVNNFGKQIFSADSRDRLNGLLADFYVHDKSRLKLFRLANKENIAHELLQVDTLDDVEKMVKTLSLKTKFQSVYSLKESMAFQVVFCFAYALGWIEENGFNEMNIAQKWYDSAVEKKGSGQIDDAKIEVEIALLLDHTNISYKQLNNELEEIIKRYQACIKEAELYLSNGILEKALDKYNEAHNIYDNADIILKISEVNSRIRNEKIRSKKINQFLTEVQSLIDEKDWLNAKLKANEILSIDNKNTAAKSHLAEIEKIEKQQEGEAILVIANKLFSEEKWVEAKQHYEKAFTFCTQDISINKKINQCVDKIKEQETILEKLISDATFAKMEGKLAEALSFLEKALIIQPENHDVIKIINKIKFDLKFVGVNTSRPIQKRSNPTKTKGDSFLNTKKVSKSLKLSKDDNVFNKTLSDKTGKSRKKDDKFILKKHTPPKKTDDGFLKNIKKQDEFFK